MKTDEEEIKIVKNILDEGVSDGIFKLDDTYFTSIAIVTALKGMEIPLVVGMNARDNSLEQRLDRLIEVLFYGILTR